MLEQDLAELRDGDETARFEAARRLGSTLDAAATAALIEALGDQNTKVQYAAMSSLIKHNDPSALGPLIDLLHARPNSPLWKLINLSAGLRLRAGLLDLVAAGDIGIADQVLAALASTKFDSHQQALFTRLIGRTADPRQVQPFIDLLASDDQVLRAAAADALGWMGDTRAVLPLIDILQTRGDREAVREIAAESLGKLGDLRAVTPLIEALTDASDWLRRAAGQSLGELGDPRAMDPLSALLGDESTMVQDTAFEAIKRLSTDSFTTTVTGTGADE
jgi:HEAT repeat protein